MAKPVEELLTPKSPRRRVELLKAGRTTFISRGYFDTRVADVVALANVSQGTFYSYFDSKDDALQTLVTQMVDEMLAQTATPIQPTKTAFLARQATIEQFMFSYRDHSGMIGVLEQAVTANTNSVIFARVFAIVSDSVSTSCWSPN